MKQDIFILGISAFYHDSAAALVKNGAIVAAAQEERFTRKKHDPSYPAHAIDYCLKQAGISPKELTHVVFYEKPFLKFERLLQTYFAYAPRGLRSFLKAMPVWLKEKLWIKDSLREKLRLDGEILFTEHHESHAASAFFPSPFEEAAILTMDGVGEWATSSYGFGRGNTITLLGETRFPHSLGLLYSAFTYYTGFRVNSGEYKLMGLAPYGEPKYADVIKKELIDIKDDGSFKLNMRYFNYGAGLTMTNGKFHRLFGGPPRRPETAITPQHMDIAASIQAVTEEVMLKTADHVQRETGMSNLCLAGGVALNCVGNGRILREGRFKDIWIQPAAGDAGGALGGALFCWYQYLDKERRSDNKHDQQAGSYLGPRFERPQLETFLRNTKARYEIVSDNELPKRVARLINEQKVIGLFQGRAEFGPRALGSRSILGDARSSEMQSLLNLKIKFRESFRPFAPSVLEEKAEDYFQLKTTSPYMLLVAPVAARRIIAGDQAVAKQGFEKLKEKRSQIPAVTHVDHSARVQTVSAKTNPLFHRIIEEFERLSGCPVIINTSFNIRGEPIVGSPEDADRCFMCTNMDYLVMENYIFEKSQQPDQDKYRKEDIVQELD